MTVEPDEVHRYVGDEEWPPTFRTFAARIRAENAALINELAERGPRPIRYSPDFSEIDGTHVFIQWKGTDVCLDFRCECGAYGHFDGGFAYALRCGSCHRAWALPHSVALVPLPESWDSAEPCDVADDSGQPSTPADGDIRGAEGSQ